MLDEFVWLFIIRLIASVIMKYKTTPILIEIKMFICVILIGMNTFDKVSRLSIRFE